MSKNKLLYNPPSFLSNFPDSDLTPPLNSFRRFPLTVILKFNSLSFFGNKSIISLARCLSFNGFGNAFKVAAINGGRHVAPTFAGDTVYAWSEVLEKYALPGGQGLGALRVRTVAAKDRRCHDFPYRDAEGRYDPAVVLDFDYTVLIPHRP